MKASENHHRNDLPPKQNSDQEEAIMLIDETFASYEAHFQEGFEDRVMQACHKATNKKKQEPNFRLLLTRIALSGAAAIILLLISIYISDGSLDPESIFGIKEYAADAALLSYLNY